MADDHAIEEAGPDGGGAGGCEATPEDRTSDAWDCVGSDETVGMTFEKLHADDETDSDEDGQDFDDAVGTGTIVSLTEELEETAEGGRMDAGPDDGEECQGAEDAGGADADIEDEGAGAGAEDGA
ncbi:hypothetical protein IQ06DRAFT_344108 [Phaeosphaeriaceae sp. SRC1lsM3a]|nr:hypothetical protein IQ06DRAFT_344108 [Stagonospora sp. SRC1lsM3a]